MDITKITNPEAKRFIKSFFVDREINREFYSMVPEDKYNFRMVDTPNRKSDSLRESLAHQINVQRTYMKAVTTGKLKFGLYYDQNLKTKSKFELLQLLEQADKELVDILSNEKNINKKIVVPWNKDRIGSIQMLWAMDSHEILHTGWNLAIMDHLNIGRFPALKLMWG